jgi:APA family basic amino acid/polyamine antiporter
VIVLRRREPGMARPYRAWGYPVTPVVFILFSAYLIVNSIRAEPTFSLIGAGLLVAGLPLYWYFMKSAKTLRR